MNTSENQRFHDLAHMALAGQATPAEQRELRALIAENPELNQEMKALGNEAGMVRELFPLLEDLKRPSGGVPQALMEKLNAEVGAVLDANAKSKGQLNDLLSGIEGWVRSRAGGGVEEAMAAVGHLRGLLTRTGLSRPFEEFAPWFLPARQASARVATKAHAELKSPKGEELHESERRQESGHAGKEDIENRLHALNTRLEKAEAISRECREEIRAILEVLTREQAGRSDRQKKLQIPPVKPQE
jgi:anti-sigma factor RsiW